jgi:acetyltransferase-like isoleucine patch superfamily enzyme
MVMGECTIGHRVKIGGNTVIRPRTTIGDDVVIGCGSVVVKDVPSGEKWAGNPARPLVAREQEQWRFLSRKVDVA